jgi:predicted nucleic acid-binding protein
VPTYLADTSAWHRAGRAADRWAELIETDELALCSPVTLELLYSARDHGDYESLARDLGRFPHVGIDVRAEWAAGRAQRALARRAQHRGASPVDLLIAGLAEVHGFVLLHYDRHFEAIARVTGQPAEWLARPGTLD